MQATRCPICSAVPQEAFSATLLKRHRVAFRHCLECGLLQTEEPFWLDEAYAAPIAATDTGLVQRNLVTAAKLAAYLHRSFGPSGPYIDVAGGYGLLVRLMRDLGFDFFWEDKYSENVLARGFEASRTAGPFLAATAFEVLEHLTDPCAFVDDTLRRTGARTLIFSTLLYRGPKPPPLDWWYYSFEAGQHVSFYRLDTLERLAARFGLTCRSAAGIHVLAERPALGQAGMRLLLGPLALPVSLYARWKRGSRMLADHRALARGTREAVSPAPRE